MNFNFSETAGLGESNGAQQLEGNKIHTVKFDGCEATDLKDGQYKTLRIKFSNDEGVFTHTIFEPRDGDDQDTQGTYGPNPAPLKEMITLLRHLGAAVSPNLVEALNTMPNNLSWDQFRKKVVDASADGIGKTTKIKLFKREKTDVNTGEKRVNAEFPRYIIAYDREGKLYMRTNFIGDKTYFTTKELQKMQAEATAKPTSSDEFDTRAEAGDSDFDDNIEI
jgi:hypothetical protein